MCFVMLNSTRQKYSKAKYVCEHGKAIIQRQRECDEHQVTLKLNKTAQIYHES